MPNNSLQLVALAALLAACGPKPKVCPADDQSGCVGATLSYDGGIGAILNQRCTPCHATGGEEATLPLTDYKHVSGEKMSIADQIVTCSMPPDGSPQLTDSERKQILAWLSCGGPE